MKKPKESSPKTNGAAASSVVDVDEESQQGAGESTNEEAGLAAVETTPSESDESAQNDELAEELEAVKDLARRKQAEFENFRKRSDRERSETIKYAAAGLMGEILPVLDNLERAIEASQAGTDENFREGVEIIYRQLRETLLKQGLEEVDAREASFDPHIHEAVGRVETDDRPDGTVIEVFLKGYRFKERLLRPAMVSVAIGTEVEEEPVDHGDDTQRDDEERDS